MSSIFCNADDEKLINKIFKCTRVEVTPVCGLISPVCESCRIRVEQFDENAKTKVIEFVIKTESDQQELGFDPLSFLDTDPMKVEPIDELDGSFTDGPGVVKIEPKKEEEKKKIGDKKVIEESLSSDGVADEDPIYEKPKRKTKKKRTTSSSSDSSISSSEEEKKKKTGRRGRVAKSEGPRTPQPCPECGKVVLYMKEHLRQHNEQKHHQCPYCERKFVQKNNLNYHIRTHTGEKPFKCEQCEKTFYCDAHLKSHMVRENSFCQNHLHIFTVFFFLFSQRMHGPQGLFQCDMCPKNFNQECNLKKHLRVHTGGLPMILNS